MPELHEVEVYEIDYELNSEDVNNFNTAKESYAEDREEHRQMRNSMRAKYSDLDEYRNAYSKWLFSPEVQKQHDERYNSVMAQYNKLHRHFSNPDDIIGAYNISREDCMAGKFKNLVNESYEEGTEVSDILAYGVSGFSYKSGVLTDGGCHGLYKIDSEDNGEYHEALSLLKQLSRTWPSILGTKTVVAYLYGITDAALVDDKSIREDGAKFIEAVKNKKLIPIARYANGIDTEVHMY